MEWDKALALVLEHARKGAAESSAVVAAILKDGRQELYQPIFNAGHSEATERDKATNKTLGELKTTLEARVVTLEAELKAAQANSPDKKALQTEYELATQKLKDENAAKVKDLNQRLENAQIDGQLALARAALTGKVEPEYMDVVLFKADETRSRVKVTDGQAEFLQKGSNIRLVPGPGKTGIQLFTEDLLASVPAKWRLSNVDGGGGGGGGNGGGGGSAGSGDKVDQFIAGQHKAAAAASNPLLPK